MLIIEKILRLIKKDGYKKMEKGIQNINKMSMKEVWTYYNKSFKNRTQTKIKLENEQAH